MPSPDYVLTDLSPSSMLYCALLSAVHIIIGSITFDLIHWKIHQSGRSSNPFLRCLSRAHIAHHQYFDRRLTFNQAFALSNNLTNAPLELFSQITGGLLSWQFSRVFALRPSLVQHEDICLALSFLIIRAGVVAFNEGRDSNHIAYTQLPQDPHSVIVGPEYHALHHIDPQGYFGSMVRFVDWVFGTASTLHGRNIFITGSSGALGQALWEELNKEKGTSVQTSHFSQDWTYENYSCLEKALRTTDILILAHGSKTTNAFKANCESATVIIETFMRVREPSSSLLRPEIWYIGSEAELHGAWTADMEEYTSSKRAFASYARAYYDDETFLYRHIVPAAFSSRMGWAIIGPKWVARVTLWWVRRGARYVPITYTGMAVLNYFRFFFWVKPTRISNRGDPRVKG